MGYNQVYPNTDDPLFKEKLEMIEEFGIYKIPPMNKIKNKEEFKKNAENLCKFEKTYYQHFVSQYISNRSPYRSMLLYHGLGSGKTCSAITIAETFLTNHRMYDEPMIWIVSKTALKESFKQDIFRMILLTTPEFIKEQCTGDSYYEMIPDHDKLSEEDLLKRMKKIINSRYKFFGYETFANRMSEYIKDGVIKEKIRNKIIIIDEAHNIRNTDLADSENKRKKTKKIIGPILDVIKSTENTRLVFLSATPMFNEAKEILWLMSLLEQNDNKSNPLLNPAKLPLFYTANNSQNTETFNLMKKLSTKYISYIRANNPLTFAVRINPKQLGIPILEKAPALTFKGNKIPQSERNWLSGIKDYLVPSVLGGIQLEYLKKLQKNKHFTEEVLNPGKSLNNPTLLRQLNNFVYIKQLTTDTISYVKGEAAILSIFKKNSNQYEYIDKKEPILDPSHEKLGEYAAKFQTISKLLQKSTGIVVIYSSFVWGSLFPVAIMLEHMGFSRVGEQDLLHSSNKKANKKIKFKDITNPKYCILTGEKDLMGSTKIDDLLKLINNTVKNENGSQIKVILMSAIASEGLSFMNVREVHILDPWYHMNTAEQAIGRAIRQCSHSSLPIEKRNVSVFLHVTVFPDNTHETEDLNTYRIASIKKSQIDNVDKVIREYALDCDLMKNANYFPKENFDFEVELTTSHETTVKYKYGNDENDKITCSYINGKKNLTLPKDTRSFREDSYKSFIPTLQLKLKKYLKLKFLTEHIKEFDYDELISIIHPNKELSHATIQASVYPYKLWENYALIYHYGIFILAEFKKEVLRPIGIQISESVEEIAEQDNTLENAENLEKIFESFANDKLEMATLKLFKSLDSKSWKEFAEKLIKTPTAISSKINPIIAILETHGAFIFENEISKGSTKKYIGYVNIFSNVNEFKGFILDKNGSFIEIVPSDINKIIKNRVKNTFIDPANKTFAIADTIGIIVPSKHKKEKNSLYRFEIKLGRNNIESNSSGVICDSLQKPNIISELKSYTNKTEGKKADLCFKLHTYLLINNRMWIPPLYKPAGFISPNYAALSK